MSTSMPLTEGVRKAAEWITEMRDLHPQKSLATLLDEAGMRCNLTPLDTLQLERLFQTDTEQHVINK